MKYIILVTTLFLTAISVYAGNIDRVNCIAKIGNKDGSFIINNSELNGKLAEVELQRIIKDGMSKVKTYQDAFGRGTFTEARTTLIELPELKDESGNSAYFVEIQRYCSKTNSDNAKCVDFCVFSSAYYDYDDR